MFRRAGHRRAAVRRPGHNVPIVISPVIGTSTVSSSRHRATAARGSRHRSPTVRCAWHSASAARRSGVWPPAVRGWGHTTSVVRLPRRRSRIRSGTRALNAAMQPHGHAYGRCGITMRGSTRFDAENHDKSHYYRYNGGDNAWMQRLLHCVYAPDERFGFPNEPVLNAP